LRMGVRCDREGMLAKDFQTAQNVATADGKKRNIISYRHYLADAAFLVGLEGEENLLQRIHNALRTPHWPLALGRKSYLPSVYPWLKNGLRNETLEEALSTFPPIDERVETSKGQIRFVLESTQPTPHIRMDDPITFALGKRRFAKRFVTYIFKERSDVFKSSDS